MQFERQLPPCRLYDVPCRSIQSTLDKWVVVTTDEVKRLIKAAPNETSRLDPAPTWLVKDMRGLLAPFLTLLFNRSLSTGCFPSEFKLAIVCPLLKKSGLDAEDPKNRRSVSTLSFFSKLLERNAQRQLQAYLNNNDLMPTQQSAYRQHHSTETAVTKVYNDLLMAADSGLVSALCLLDLTAAFDTVDHDLQLMCLERPFGLRGVPLPWFASYLRCRSYRVWHGGCSSRTVWVVCSVPRGSVLGPRLFSMYAANLADNVKEHKVTLHRYADDTQLYIHCQPNEAAAAVAVLERCIKDVDDWMSANRLKLNMDKTKLLWVESKYNLSKLNGSGLSLQLKSSTVNSRQHVRVLGVQFLSDLSLNKHISCVSSSCFHQLRQLRRIRRSLDKESAATLVHAFVTSRVDYRNAVFAAAPKTATDKLQCVLNAAAKLISDTRKYDQGLSRLIHHDLYWLDISERVSYKLCLLTHRCLFEKAPV